jgi:hypothetical protein
MACDGGHTAGGSKATILDQHALPGALRCLPFTGLVLYSGCRRSMSAGASSWGRLQLAQLRFARPSFLVQVSVGQCPLVTSFAYRSERPPCVDICRAAPLRSRAVVDTGCPCWRCAALTKLAPLYVTGTCGGGICWWRTACAPAVHVGTVGDTGQLRAGRHPHTGQRASVSDSLTTVASTVLCLAAAAVRCVGEITA